MVTVEYGRVVTRSISQVVRVLEFDLLKKEFGETSRKYVTAIAHGSPEDGNMLSVLDFEFI